jgi:outer membrane lipoprotein carrier protein
MASRRRIGRGAALICMVTGVAAVAADAPASNALDRYLTGLDSLSATFTQTVSDSKGEQIGTGAGHLLVQRPGKFRWDYAPTPSAADPAAPADSSTQRGQLLVADGSNLWFYDRELAQVTVKPVEAALSATPIVLLSGSAAQLHDSFAVNAEAAHDGMDWVEVKPRSAEADFNRAELGFSGGKLARMVVKDRLGQTVELDFSHSERNAHVSADLLKFKPPAGVDVIGRPQD